MKFEKYPILPAIKTNLAALGFNRLTDIQYKAMPSIMKGEDVLAIAQTGTGKTAAFAIPLVQHIPTSRRRATGVRALVMCLPVSWPCKFMKCFAALPKALRHR